MAVIGIQLGFLFIGVLLLWRMLDRVRLIRKLQDTPTSKIGSAPQGFVQVGGLTQAREGAALYVPELQVPCVWYRYEVYEEAVDNEDDARPQSVQQTSQRFRIADRTGDCIVDPNGAEIDTRKSRRWVAGGMQHHAHWIGVGEHVTVIGWLASLHPRPQVADELRRSDGTHSGRYGQLEAVEHIVGKAPHEHLPYYIGASHEIFLLKKLRRQMKGYLLGFLIMGVIFPLLITLLQN